MKLDKRRCEKYRRKAKACKGCPAMALLGGKPDLLTGSLGERL